MYSRNWLKAQIASYLKDASLSAELDTFIDIGAKRISGLLECWEMEQVVSNSLTFSFQQGILDGGGASGTSTVVVDGGDAYNADPEAAPKNYIEFYGLYKRLVAVQTLDNGIWRNLKAVPKHEASAYKYSGVPLVYLVENRRIYPLPFLDGDYRAIFQAEIEIPVGDGEVDALTAYPYLFLNAALAEAYDWKQDEIMSARYEQKWMREAEQIKLVYRSEHSGETPSMRAV